MSVKIEGRIGVQTPPEVIWEIVYDVESWPSWNPIYPKAQGVVRIGKVLNLTLALPGLQPELVEGAVVDWVPNEQLLWRSSTHGGFGKTMRYLEIEKLSDSACIFSNGEIYGGFVGTWLAKRRRKQIRAGFDSLCAAVKARAEALYVSRGGVIPLIDSEEV